jgi:hypothetical protein
MEMRGTATREHILPQWLHPHIELPGVSLKHRAVDEERITLLRSHDLQTFTFKSICSNCNNGWMSQLEADVKPLLLPLLEGTRSVGSLAEGRDKASRALGIQDCFHDSARTEDESRTVAPV